jgi:hypothetical protein
LSCILKTQVQIEEFQEYTFSLMSDMIWYQLKEEQWLGDKSKFEEKGLKNEGTG